MAIESVSNHPSGIPPELRESQNTLNVERVASLIAGGVLLSIGWRLRSPARIFAIIGGGTLAYWGVTGDRRLCRIIGFEQAETRSGIASVRHDHAIRIEKTITVGGSLESIYRIWRNPENLPCFMDHIQAVRAISSNRSHWMLKGPAGKAIQWESEIYNEKPNEFFAWRSMLNADVNHAGSIHFRRLPDSSQTEIRVILSYEPPGGMLGSWLARLSGNDPVTQLEHYLWRFKTVFEAGRFTVH
jgi:uncharacterized membrane protein